MTFKKRITTFLLVLVVILAIGGELLLSLFAVRADAAEGTSTTYSNVLEDLQKDSSFDASAYPDKPDDYSLQVIQVAEGENGELFVYVYQPSNATVDLKAAKINMSLQEPTDDTATFDLYNLTWLNSSGVFDKYKVNDFTVPDEATRFYSIATVYRAFDETIGDEHLAGSDDITDFKAYRVGTSWSCRVFNDTYQVKSNKFNVLDVEINAVGFLSFFDGYDWGLEYVDAHFVAFSALNYKIDYIKKAEITYEVVDYVGLGQSRDQFSIVSYDEETRETKKQTLYDTETSGVDAFWGDYSWSKISDISTFKEDAEDEKIVFAEGYDENGLNNAQFVFRFLETECREGTVAGTSTRQISGTLVSKVTLLSLTFLSNNQTYNLGVVADIVSDDGSPDGYEDTSDKWYEDIMKVLSLIVIIFILNAFKPLLEFIFFLLKAALNSAFAIISFPFKLIGKLLK